MIEQRIVQEKSNVILVDHLSDHVHAGILLFDDVVFEDGLGVE